MNLQELKQHFEKLPDGILLKFKLSDPFSWRGSYDEVAFHIEEMQSTKQEALEAIEKAYKGHFYGYKGGTYTYYDYTQVHFEENYGAYTDGWYTQNLISKITGNDLYRDEDERLVKLAFN